MSTFTATTIQVKDGGGTAQFIQSLYNAANTGAIGSPTNPLFTGVVLVDASGNQSAFSSHGLMVDGSGVTQPVSLASLPLPAGAATSALQPVPGTAGTPSTQVLTFQGIASMVPMAINPVKGTPNVTAAAPGSVTASILLNANATRKQAIFFNNGTQTVFLGNNASVTANNGMPLGPSATLVDDSTTAVWYGIAASGTGDVRMVEIA